MVASASFVNENFEWLIRTIPRRPTAIVSVYSNESLRFVLCFLLLIIASLVGSVLLALLFLFIPTAGGFLNLLPIGALSPLIGFAAFLFNNAVDGSTRCR